MPPELAFRAMDPLRPWPPLVTRTDYPHFCARSGMDSGHFALSNGWPRLARVAGNSKGCFSWPVRLFQNHSAIVFWEENCMNLAPFSMGRKLFILLSTRMISSSTTWTLERLDNAICRPSLTPLASRTSGHSNCPFRDKAQLTACAARHAAAWLWEIPAPSLGLTMS